jgi:hypothetical protein
MAKKAADFIIKLSKDPKLRDQLKKDPHGTMDAHGLSSEDKDALMSGDPDRIRQHLGDDGPPGCFVIFIA